MTERKTLQKLTLKDNFLFAAVMSEPENCKQLLELTLGIAVDHVEVDTEKSIVYHPQYKGIRLDVFARDEKGTRFNVEMQVAGQPLERRCRYYHSQMDMDLLLSGVPYGELPDSYVVFLCDFDPFLLGKYRYTVKHVFAEDGSFHYEDGSHTVFLSTKGKNEEEVPEALVRFLKFLSAEEAESMGDFGDDYVRCLQLTIRRIKSDREMGERYMLFEEMLKDERTEGWEEGRASGLAEGKAKGLVEGKTEGLAEGRAEGLVEGRTQGHAQGRIEGAQEMIFELLSLYGEVPADLGERIRSVKDTAALGQLLKKAAQVKSISEFESLTEL